MRADATDGIAFLRSIELAAVHAYEASASSAVIGDDAGALLELVKAHHVVYADDLDVLLSGAGRDAPNPRLLDELLERFQGSTGDEAAYLAVLSEFELQSAATYIALIPTFDGATTVDRIAGIAPVTASHGVALGVLAGRPPSTLFGEAGILPPSSAFAADRYPI